MNRISFYNPHLSTFGGGEKYFAILAETLSRQPGIQISIFTDVDAVRKSDLESKFSVDLSGISFEYIQNPRALIERTKGQDIFICLSNFRTITSSARHHVQLLQIPYPPLGLASIVKRLGRGNIEEAVKDIYRRNLMAFSKKQADLVIVNSRFVSDTLAKNYGIKASILYPPIQDFSDDRVEKKNLLLSVGRFFSGLYNDKRYDILTEAFREIYHRGLTEWEYHIVGNASDDAATTRMLQSLAEQNQGYPVIFHINESYDQLRRLYNQARIFWHAAGYAIEEPLHPENVEHFGMTTVEAMSAGCIPVVINKGGQREIIAHRENGFRWDSVDELIQYTLEIAGSRLLADSLRQKARLRFEDFDLQMFRRQSIQILSPVLGSNC